MPGMYKEVILTYLVFVGIAEKDELNRIDKIKFGDTLIALASSGVHSKWFLVW